MRHAIGTLVLGTVLALQPAAAQPVPDGTTLEVTGDQAVPPPGEAQPPATQPPPPPAVVAPPVPEPAPAQPAPAGGQWVYTGQYGWVWMPYGSAYSYLPPDGSSPCMFVYYPVNGWCWVVAPWLWGWGPCPFFGRIGPRAYFWYGRGIGRWYGFGPRYRSRGSAGRAYLGGGRWVGVQRPAFNYWAPSNGLRSPGFRGGFQGGHR